MITWE